MNAAGAKPIRVRAGVTRLQSARIRTQLPSLATDSLVRNSTWAMLSLAGHLSLSLLAHSLHQRLIKQIFLALFCKLALHVAPLSQDLYKFRTRSTIHLNKHQHVSHRFFLHHAHSQIFLILPSMKILCQLCLHQQNHY